MLSLSRALVALLANAALAIPALAEPAMWTLKDADTTINIFGTVHLLPEGTQWRSPRMEAAFEAADSVCFEVDVIGRALEALSLTYEHGVQKGGDRLTNHITDAQEKDLRASAKAFGVPFVSLNVMEPWFASMTLEQYAYERMGLEDGVEFTLYPEIDAGAKTLCEMETLDEQMGSLWRMSLEDQIAVLFYESEETKDLNTQEQIEYSATELKDLVADWLAGDVAAIGATIDDEAGGNEAFHEALLVSRNKRWVPRIEEMLARKGGNIFIAVGAAHLAGDDSVIKMLRDKGYEIDGP